jgi:hypothetical protein
MAAITTPAERDPVVRGNLWRRSRHGGGSYLCGRLEDGSHVVVWLEEPPEGRLRRLKGQPAARIEIHAPRRADR